METENRFNEGDTVHDIDGNTFRVRNGRACLEGGGISYDLATTGRCFMYRHEFEALPYRLRIERNLLSLTPKSEAATLFSASQIDESLAAARVAFPEYPLAIEARGELFVVATDGKKVCRWLRL